MFGKTTSSESPKHCRFKNLIRVSAFDRPAVPGQCESHGDGGFVRQEAVGQWVQYRQVVGVDACASGAQAVPA